MGEQHTECATCPLERELSAPVTPPILFHIKNSYSHVQQLNRNTDLAG
jgi:hypothetical protein